MIPISIAAFLMGSVVGSFLNVCIYRIPRGLSIIWPSSRCPLCKIPIRPHDNIPIISFLVLGGRCRNCGERIPFRYPAVEMMNALLYVAAVWRYGVGWHTPFLFLFCSVMIVIAFIDLDHQIIPDVITLPGIPFGLIAGSFLFPDPFARTGPTGFVNGLIGLFSGGGLFYAIAVLSRGGMGGGDIKMMAMVGAFSGWKSIFLTTFAGSLLGSIAGIFLMVFKGKGRKTRVPFGPFLALGALITLFCGREILDLYLRR